MSKFDHSFNSLVNFTPLLLMTGLALFSFVLIKQNPQVTVKTELLRLGNTDHDYYLQNFSTTRYAKSGQADAHINGKSAEHFVQTEELAIQNINFHFFKEPNFYQGIANKGVINDATNSIQLYDKVSVTRRNLLDKTMDATFESQFLKLTTQPDTLSTDSSVKISDRRSVIIANSLQYDATAKMIKMNGSVNIKINSSK
jgi:LPS export ABC transporter protein LptC